VAVAVRRLAWAVTLALLAELVERPVARVDVQSSMVAMGRLQVLLAERVKLPVEMEPSGPAVQLVEHPGESLFRLGQRVLRRPEPVAMAAI